MNQNKFFSETGRFIGSEAPSQLIKHNWVDTSHDWFTRSTDLKSLDAYLLFSTLNEKVRLKPVLDTYLCRLFNEITYCTKLTFHMGLLSSI